MRATQITLLMLAMGTGPAVRAQAPKSPPTALPRPEASGAAATGRVSVELTFLEPSGATLAEQRADLTVGRTETVSVQRGNRTVSAEITVSGGGKAGCHHIDVTVRDKTIDSTGHFNKTVWQSASDPCGRDAITLGPKEETRLRVAIKPTR